MTQAELDVGTMQETRSKRFIEQLEPVAPALLGAVHGGGGVAEQFFVC